MKPKNSEKRRKQDVESDDRKKKLAKTRKSNPSSKKINPHELHQLIRKRAYNVYRQRVQRNLGGDDLTDWLQAEEELRYSNTMEDM